MDETRFQSIVTEVVRRLARRLGADSSRGKIIVIFSGATVAFKESIDQVRHLILDGYQLQFVFSQAAEQIFGPVVMDQLEGFPHNGLLKSSEWFSALKETRAVVIPLLSVNTLSKASQLIADNLVTNLILHAFLMEKKVVVAKNGVDTMARGRHFQKGTPALRQAIQRRLQTVESYGCRLTDVNELRNNVNSILSGNRVVPAGEGNRFETVQRNIYAYSRKMVTAAVIRRAQLQKSDLKISSQSLITPLARDLAMQHGVAIIRD